MQTFAVSSRCSARWRTGRRSGRASRRSPSSISRTGCALLPVRDQFVKSASGAIDPAFWRSIYKERNESGGSYVSGWIHVLCPYLDGDTHDGGGVRPAIGWAVASRSST